MLYSHARYGDQNYENKLECDWVIEAREGYKISFYFNAFEIEDETDCGYVLFFTELKPIQRYMS